MGPQRAKTVSTNYPLLFFAHPGPRRGEPWSIALRERLVHTRNVLRYANMCYYTLTYI